MDLKTFQTFPILGSDGARIYAGAILLAEMSDAIKARLERVINSVLGPEERQMVNTVRITLNQLDGQFELLCRTQLGDYTATAVRPPHVVQVNEFVISAVYFEKHAFTIVMPPKVTGDKLLNHETLVRAMRYAMQEFIYAVAEVSYVYQIIKE